MAHTLDGIDGKQARRTGSSSPLGEMFDHGLDSWSTSLFLLNFITRKWWFIFSTKFIFVKIFETFLNFFLVFGHDGITPTESYFLLWLLCANFLCSHWEKYNTGIMYLPWGYDVSQGKSTLVLCSFWTPKLKWRFLLPTLLPLVMEQPFSIRMYSACQL